jgi:hypothetical protein
VPRAGRGDALGEKLDALVALERPAGGWTFAAPPGARPEPFTLVVKTAEHLLAPLGLATWDLVVVRSPGTPAAGLVLLDAYRRSGRQAYLDAAQRAGDFLLATEVAPGGWFSEVPATGTSMPWWFRWSAGERPMLDDDVTPGAIRLLLALWNATGDARYRAGAERGVALLLRAQLPGGAWPLVARPAWLRRLRAHYEDQPALNDGATPSIITTLLEAASDLGRPELRAAAQRGGDWLVAAQHATRGGGWAQQYDGDGRPASARAFELPALASWETRHATEALLALYAATHDRRYCEAADRALDWLVHVRVGSACWARYYDLETGAPLFADADGRRVRTAAEARPGYYWLGEFGIPWLLAFTGREESAAPHRLPGDAGTCREDPRPPPPLAGARALVAGIDSLETSPPPPGGASPCRDAGP